MTFSVKLLLLAAFAMPTFSWASEQDMANEKVVLDFFADMDTMTANSAVQDVPRIVAKYWTADCIQHRAGVGPGHAGMIKSLGDLSMDPKSIEARKKMMPLQDLSITSADDRVVLVRRRVSPDATSPTKVAERYVFLVFRMKGGKIAENWWAISYVAPTTPAVPAASGG